MSYGLLEKPGLKYCTGHLRMEPLENFGKDKILKSGYRSSCKQYRREHYYNKERDLATVIRSCRKRGILPMGENPNCSQFLGIYIAERVLSKVFKNVTRMPNNFSGYDFICSKGKKIEVKSGTFRVEREYWIFNINRNTKADLFLLLAFDDRTNLNPQHIWLIPNEILCQKLTTTISPTTLSKWAKYERPLDKVISCCNMLKEEGKTLADI